MGRSVATYYDILRVGRRADPDGLRCAYRRLAQKYHPDKLPNNADAVRVMAMLNEAYAVLSDPDQRARYDRRIEAAEQAVAGRARRRAIAPVEVPMAAWPWYLLFATMAFAAATFGTALYKTLVPGVAVAVAVQVPAPAKPAKN